MAGAAADLDEFGEIARLFRPLTRGAFEARGLTDDVAVIAGRPGLELVVTTDTLVEGVHFLPDDPPDLVAQKLLRVNLSDLAAKGAEPFGWFLNVAWPHASPYAVRARFAQGLEADQRRFGLSLFGGDTVATPGPWTLSATMLGWSPAGATPARAGARPGDVLLVSGTIGDGALGLEAARDPARFGAAAVWLIDRYRLPQPRLDLQSVVRRFARASCDVSDGLLADAARIAAASGCAVEIALESIPLSRAAASHDRLALATGGDDYELLLAVAPGDVAEALADGRLTPVGAFTRGQGLTVTLNGAPQTLGRLGWTHGNPAAASVCSPSGELSRSD